MKLQPVRELLGTDLFAAPIGDAMELAQVAKQPNLRLPAAYLVPDTETLLQDAMSGSLIFEQVLQSTFAVVMLVSSDKARKGVAADQIGALEEAVITRLHGQQPEGWSSPLGIADLATADITPSYVVRVLRFRGRRRIRTTRQP